MLQKAPSPDTLVIADRSFRSRLFLGTARYPSSQLMLDAVAASGTEMVTAAIRRVMPGGEEENMVELLAGRVHFLPNTEGCYTEGCDPHRRTRAVWRITNIDGGAGLSSFPETSFDDGAVSS